MKSLRRMWRFAILLACGLVMGCGWVARTPSSGLVFPVQSVDGKPISPTPGAELAERAAVNPFDPVALNNLAISEAARGRYQQALMLLQRAVKLAPARPDIAANLHSLQRWLVLAEGQAAVGASPQPLALPYQENLLPEVPSLWQAPPVVAPGALPVSRSVPVINNNPTKNISPAAPATITKPLAQKAIPSSTAWHARKKSTSSIKPIKEKEGR